MPRPGKHVGVVISDATIPILLAHALVIVLAIKESIFPVQAKNSLDVASLAEYDSTQK